MFQEIPITGKYLMIPVRNQGDMISVIFSGSNMTIPLNLIPGTREDCDFIASYPLHFFGNTLRIDGKNLDWLSEVTQSDLPATAPYDCPERQQFHYSATTGWLNDPNGLHWYNGEWHMFHQYNPLSNDWENMHWYHAVSSDLVHWKELGVTIPPLPCGTAFSGGAVIDWQNTSGLQEDPLYPPILLFYTAHIRKNNRPAHTQHLFYSTDGGKNYRKYSDEPIIGTFSDGGDRDPSVAWDPVHDEWLMALYLGDSNREFALLRSDDLIHWQEIQRFLMPDQGRECPELLWMRDDASGDYYWVILEANGNYLVWERQNGTMHPISEGKFLRLGKEYYGYACQTFTNAPDGVTGIGWQRSKIRHAAFFQSMTLPFQLRLYAGKLFVFPHPALETLRTGATEWNDLQPGTPISAGNGLWELELTLPASGELALSLCGIPLSFRKDTLQLGNDIFDRPADAGTFRIFLDRTSVEIFAANGAFWCAQAADPDLSQPLIAASGTIPHLRIYPLSAIR